MSESNRAFGKTLVKSLVGERGHLPIARALPDITVELAGKRIEGVPYTIYQLLKHMSYWQNFLLTYLDGGKPQLPSSVAESSPSGGNQEVKTNGSWLSSNFCKELIRPLAIQKACSLMKP